jgi:VanZ family protein
MWSKPPSQKNQAHIKLQILLRAWLPTLLLIGIVAVVSTSLFGANRTSPLLYKIYVHFFGPTTNDRWWLIHMFIRKSGHLCGYGLLSAAFFRSWWLTLRMYFASKSAINATLTVTLRRKAHLLAIFSTLIVAIADEIHQSFIPNRTGSAWDVLIDVSAAIAAQLLIWLAIHFLSQHSKQKARAHIECKPK